MKPKRPGKKAGWVTVAVNILFIAAICAVGWQIADHLIQDKASGDLTQSLLRQVAVTARPDGETALTTARPAPVPAENTREDESVPEEIITEDESIPEEKDAGEDIQQAEGNKTQFPAESAGDEAGQRTAEHTKLPPADTTGRDSETQAEGHAPLMPDETAKTEQFPETEAPAETAVPTETEGPAETAEPRYPDDPDAPEQIDFDTLRQTCRGAYAWLYCPAAGINYPVMQTGDNEYYLSHMADGSRNKAGALFIDWRNDETLRDRNTIIYGHNMKNGTMFGQLARYREADYCRDHPFMYLYIPGHRFRLDVIAAMETMDLSAYYDQPAAWEEWNTLVREAMEKTAWNFGISPGEGDHFVTLSTCAYDYRDERWIVICRVDDPDGILQEPPG